MCRFGFLRVHPSVHLVAQSVAASAALAAGLGSTQLKGGARGTQSNSEHQLEKRTGGVGWWGKLRGGIGKRL